MSRKAASGWSALTERTIRRSRHEMEARTAVVEVLLSEALRTFWPDRPREDVREERVQEVVRRTLEGLARDRIRSMTELKRYFHTVRRNLWVDQVRRWARRPREVSLEDRRERTGWEPADPTPSEDRVLAELDYRRFREHLADLGDRDPEAAFVLVEKAAHGTPEAELAGRLGCSTRKIRRKFRKGRAFVQERMSREGPEATG